MKTFILVAILALSTLYSSVVFAQAGVQSAVMVSGVTTNTSIVMTQPPKGPKSFFGQVDGTGAISVTLEVWGGFDTAASITNKILLCTITLSGTTTAQDACPVVTANFPVLMVQSLSITGTGATAKVLVGY
ncbi:MAG: hypothetical protein D4R44_08160 [Actinobacteria bacterium]|nr:MAG: hypothetical protein D4R44_08160 [Actinomycetota bacterium]